MLLKDKVLLVSYAASCAGYKAIEIPVEHALIYNLWRKKTLSFEGYLFGVDYYPPFDGFETGVHYPRSIQLASDLNRLITCDLLTITTSSAQGYSLTEFGRQKVETILQTTEKIENKSFKDITHDVADRLSDKRALIQECYRIYLNEPVRSQ